ncbi:cystathionine gamma-synthase family protein [Achromobacter seleniivolatilans]|uniref:Cystathionine gamma-synthase family protein n=1 Tax=Achromobacter seleniivolatilans TaxID=3047478 RepID=A0ABY9M9G4_9BURK|nr:cystathionine gamma-synthase family protein [Achromobacter sp. R39]WMD23268.1 cystathionine gamma-synthase family protein [Achromobacter sp. R39]
MHQNGFTTTILHSDRQQSVEHGAVHKPMHPSSEFAYDDARELAAVFQGKAGFTYARQGTPTTTALEAKINHMEGGKGTVSFATGMAALAAIFTTLLRRGDHLVSSQFVFGNTNSLLGTLLELGVEITFVDATDASQVRGAIQPNTRMVFTETIANPGTQVADLAVIGQICREKNLVYVVDNTLTSPWMFRPSSVGASLVMNSLSKYIGGHGNALGGAVTDTGLYDWSDYSNIYDAYRKGAPTSWGLTQIKKKGLRDMGGTLAAEPAHRIAVGAETLALRMAKHCANALALARLLEEHRGVAKVHYPGLASHPQHARAAAMFGSRFGGLLGVELADGVDCFDFLNRLKIVLMATHLGDTRSLALPAAHTIYYEMGAERRKQMGIADSLIRVSVGIEDEADLLFDFDQALNGCLKG